MKIPAKTTIIRLLTALAGILAIFLTGATLWAAKNFGPMKLEQILWHIVNASAMGAMDRRILYRATGIGVLTFLAAAIWGWIVLDFSGLVAFSGRLWKKAAALARRTLRLFAPLPAVARTVLKTSPVPSLCLCLLSCVFLGIALWRFSTQFDLASLFTDTHDQGLIAAHYSVPKLEEIVFASAARGRQQKNLVVVLAESLENSVGNDNKGRNHIPFLREFRSIAAHADAMREVHGTNWTIAALTAWSFGLPLKIPRGIDRNGYGSKYGFLPRAKSIFDVLKRHGYTLEVILGSSIGFSGKDRLFGGHGSFAMYDREHWSKTYDPGAYGGTAWGYNDAFTFARGFEAYERLRASGSPFVLVIETVDTHAPFGFCPPERQRYHDIRDAYRELDRNLEAFVGRMLPTLGDDTVLVILGGPPLHG